MHLRQITNQSITHHIGPIHAMPCIDRVQWPMQVATHKDNTGMLRIALEAYLTVHVLLRVCLLEFHVVAVETL